MLDQLSLIRLDLFDTQAYCHLAKIKEFIWVKDTVKRQNDEQS